MVGKEPAIFPRYLVREALAQRKNNCAILSSLFISKPLNCDMAKTHLLVKRTGKWENFIYVRNGMVREWISGLPEGCP